MKVVVMYDYSYKDDYDFLANGQNITIIDGTKAEFKMGTENFYAFLMSVDLVIFRNDAHFMLNRFNKDKNVKNFKEFFNSKVKKVWWTMDSHHLWQIEQNFQQYFDKLYVAHSQFIHKFYENKVIWMPGYFESCSIKKLLSLIGRKNCQLADIGMVYEAYINIGNRNIILNEIAHRIKKMGKSYYFGKISKGDKYIQLLQSFLVGLSVSLFGNNVDQRLFEIIGGGGILLTEKTLDHERIKLNSKNIHYFNRTLNDFELKLEEALADERVDLNGIYEVLNYHMYNHRIVAIINDCMKTKYKFENIPMWFIRQQFLINRKNNQAIKMFDNTMKSYTGNFLEIRAIITCIQYEKFFEAEDLLLNLDIKSIPDNEINETIQILEYCIKSIYRIVEQKNAKIEHWYLLALLMNKERKVMLRSEIFIPELSCENPMKKNALKEQAIFIRNIFLENQNE